MNQDLQTFYDLTKRTRAKVLDWLATLPPEVFRHEHETFAYGSLRNIYSHVADCYLGWVGEVGLKNKPIEIAVNDVSELREVFTKVDTTLVKALRPSIR